MNISDYPELCERVARCLAGRPVLIRWRDPYLKGAAGLAHQTSEGLAVVDLGPGADLRLFLHEVAHVKKGELPYTTELKPASHVLTEFGAALYKASPDEPEADTQADKWAAQANTYAYLFGGGLAGQLQALKHSPGDLRALAIKQIARQINQLSQTIKELLP